MKIPIGMELGHMTYSALFQLFVFSENFIAQIRGTCQSLFFSLPCKKEHFSGYCLRRGMRLYSVPLPSQGRLMIFQGIHLCLCFSCFKTTTLFLIRILGKGLHFEHNLLIHVAQSFTTYFLEVFTEHRWKSIRKTSFCETLFYRCSSWESSWLKPVHLGFFFSDNCSWQGQPLLLPLQQTTEFYVQG